MRTLLSFLLLVSLSTTCSASLRITGGLDPIAVPINNDFKSDIAANFGADMVYNGGADATVLTDGFLTFFYHGAESGFDNAFEVGGSPIKDENDESPFIFPGQSIGSVLPVFAGDTLSSLGIGFSSYTSPTSPGLAGTSGFGIFYNSAIGGNSKVYSTLLAGFDDQVGSPIDDNHDDMVVSIVFTAVPEATSLLVWGAMLLPLGFVCRRALLQKSQA